jgi:hypothetical protein
MQHRITSVTPLGGYRLALVFDQGLPATVDLTGFFAEGEVTEPFRHDADLFGSRLTIEGGGEWLAWPNDVEIDADALWYKAFPDELRHDLGIEAA